MDRFHEDTEWKGGEDKLMRGVEGYGTGAGGKKEGKGWRAVKSWQVSRLIGLNLQKIVSRVLAGEL